MSFFLYFFPFFASFFGNNFCSKHSFPLNKYRVCNLVNPFLRSFLFPTLNDMKTFCLMPNSIKVFNNTNWKVHRNAKFTNKTRSKPIYLNECKYVLLILLNIFYLISYFWYLFSKFTHL